MRFPPPSLASPFPGAVALASALLALAPPARAASPAECSALGALSPPDTTIGSTTWMPATSTLPEHCRVEGVIGPGQIGFALQLPTAWNGGLYHAGGGGYVGFIPAGDAGLAQHFATAATDTGHKGTGPFGGALDGTWALGNPQAKLDFGYRAVHVTTVTAKSIAAAYYGRAPGLAYFAGCSRGGGQGLMEAQRFPADFDGILVGAPAFHWTEFMQGFNWDSRALAAGPLPVEKLPLIANAVTAECDARDGLADGLIQDPRRCGFDPISLLCPGADGPGCLTLAQVSAVRKVYGGPRDSLGRSITPGFPPGAEDGPDGWALWISGGAVTPSLQFTFQDQFFRYLVYDSASYDPFSFNFDTDQADLIAIGQLLDAIDPDLSAFQARGGKILMYHGTNDHALSLYKTIQYYDEVLDVMHHDAQRFFRLFFAPGMHHCGGGPGLDTFDAFTALQDWVERGRAPDRIVASSTARPGLTRPLCPYPREARYKGHGSTNDASSFLCVPPEAARHGPR
ncbi:MAG TPA: tannase/feruloyl esterase family alpha/beta hydrolase [Anaeromyxobacteraceae bacterium]|nr:tannase/feruloyl esterase family alpha/beta hydrolase [Anaeromyxobacteraceae bacterium]